MKINFGCGLSPKKGYINVDYLPAQGVNKVVDLEIFPYPFQNEYANQIISYHTMEHLADTTGFIKECARILRPKGELHIIIPHFTSAFAHIPLHKNYYYSGWFKLFARGRKKNNGLDDPKKLFSSLKIHLNFSKGGALWNHIIEWLVNQNERTQSIYENSFAYWFPCKEIDLRFKK